jgi:hypothetical protein
MTIANLGPPHPRADELQRFLLGDLPEPDLARLAQHLEGCQACQQFLPSEVPDDPLIAALRQPLQAEPLSDEPECAETISRLEHKLSAELQGCTPAPPDTSSVPPAGQSTPETKTFDLFASALPFSFGRYQILERLGKGGMGTVYLAHDTTLDREVALKVSRLPSEDAAKVERFLREARAAAGLRHESICRVLDFGIQDGIHYLTMEYIPGQSLSSVLKAGQPLEQRQTANLVRRVALALDAAHRQGVIHRDLKPANIMLDEQGQPKVVDFGVARREQDAALTQSGTSVGTPTYMSPEQISAGRVGPASDLFSLGLILYQLLTGQRAFSGETMSQLVYQIVHTDPEPPSTFRPDLDPRLELICLKALAKSPKDRQASMAELAGALQEYLSDTSSLAPALGTAGSSPLAPVLGGEGLGVRGKEQKVGSCSPLPLSWEEAVVSGAASPLAPPGRLAGTCAAPMAPPSTSQTRSGRWRLRRWLIGTAVLLIGAAVAGYLALRDRSADNGPVSPSGSGGRTEAPPLEGRINVLVWDKKDPERQGLWLNKEGALPLKEGDLVRLEATVNRPVYPYVLWIDTEGKVLPIYPWRNGKWTDRRPERTVKQLSLPEEEATGKWEIGGGPPGMETIVLLLRETPLPKEKDRDWQKLLPDRPPQQAQNPTSAVWFENGQVVHHERERAPKSFDVKRINDPVLETQRFLHEKLSRDCDYTVAVSFAHQGKR